MPMAPKIVADSMISTQLINYMRMLGALEEGLSVQGCHIVRADDWNKNLMEAACILKGEGGTMFKTHVVFTQGKTKIDQIHPRGKIIHQTFLVISYFTT